MQVMKITEHKQICVKNQRIDESQVQCGVRGISGEILEMMVY